MKKDINHIFYFPHKPEKVWDYLTKPELLEQWLMKNDIKPVAGHKFQFKSGPAPQIGFDGNVYCEILEVVPNQLLSYSWNCGPEKGRITVESTVIWTLNPKDNGTELTLKHTGIYSTETLVMYDAMYAGWASNAKKLADRLNNITK